MSCRHDIQSSLLSLLSHLAMPVACDPLNHILRAMLKLFTNAIPAAATGVLTRLFCILSSWMTSSSRNVETYLIALDATYLQELGMVTCVANSTATTPGDAASIRSQVLIASCPDFPFPTYLAVTPSSYCECKTSSSARFASQAHPRKKDTHDTETSLSNE